MSAWYQTDQLQWHLRNTLKTRAASNSIKGALANRLLKRVQLEKTGSTRIPTTEPPSTPRGDITPMAYRPRRSFSRFNTRRKAKTSSIYKKLKKVLKRKVKKYTKKRKMTNKKFKKQLNKVSAPDQWPIVAGGDQIGPDGTFNYIAQDVVPQFVIDDPVAPTLVELRDVDTLNYQFLSPSASTRAGLYTFDSSTAISGHNSTALVLGTPRAPYPEGVRQYMFKGCKTIIELKLRSDLPDCRIDFGYIIHNGAPGYLKYQSTISEPLPGTGVYIHELAETSKIEKMIPNRIMPNKERGRIVAMTTYRHRANGQTTVAGGEYHTKTQALEVKWFPKTPLSIWAGPAQIWLDDPLGYSHFMGKICSSKAFNVIPFMRMKRFNILAETGETELLTPNLMTYRLAHYSFVKDVSPDQPIRVPDPAAP